MTAYTGEYINSQNEILKRARDVAYQQRQEAAQKMEDAWASLNKQIQVNSAGMIAKGTDPATAMARLEGTPVIQNARKAYAAAQTNYNASDKNVLAAEQAGLTWSKEVEDNIGGAADKRTPEQMANDQQTLRRKLDNLEKKGVFASDEEVAAIEDRRNARADTNAARADQRTDANNARADARAQNNTQNDLARSRIALETAKALSDESQRAITNNRAEKQLELMDQWKRGELDADKVKTELTRIYNEAQVNLKRVDQIASAAGAVYSAQLTQRGQDIQNINANTSFAASTGNAALDYIAKVGGRNAGQAFGAILTLLRDHCHQTGGCKEVPREAPPEQLIQIMTGKSPEQQSLSGEIPSTKPADPTVAPDAYKAQTDNGDPEVKDQLTKISEKVTGSNDPSQPTETVPGDTPPTQEKKPQMSHEISATNVTGQTVSDPRDVAGGNPPSVNAGQTTVTDPTTPPILPSHALPRNYDNTHMEQSQQNFNLSNYDRNSQQSNQGGVGGITINVGGPAPASTPSPNDAGNVPANDQVLSHPQFQGLVTDQVAGILKQAGFDPDVINQYRQSYNPMLQQQTMPQVPDLAGMMQGPSDQPLGLINF